jgi:vesicle-fusing ATPase
LLEGLNGCGKTALAAHLASKSEFSFVKLITPQSFVGYDSGSKVREIKKIFDDAYKSPLSLIILDDIERLMEYIRKGPHFSNVVLQALLVLIKQRPENPDRKLVILGTTAERYNLQDFGLISTFDRTLHIPNVVS